MRITTFSKKGLSPEFEDLISELDHASAYAYCR